MTIIRMVITETSEDGARLNYIQTHIQFGYGLNSCIYKFESNSNKMKFSFIPRYINR